MAEMDDVLSWLFWGAFIILMMRFGCGAHMFGHKKHGHKQKEAGDGSGEIKWEHPHAAMDPVCNKPVDPRAAKTSIHNGDVFYFCSESCRSKFESLPDSYVSGRAISPQTHTSNKG